MARRTNITGASWATSGTATAASTGLNTLTGTTLVHVGSTDIPAGSSSTGYVQGATGTSMAIKIEANGSAFSAGATDYWHRMWIRPQRDANALPATGTSYQVWNMQDGSAGRVLLWMVNRVDNNGADGLNIYESNYNFSPTLAALNLLGASGSASVIPYNPVGQLGGWVEVVLHVTVGASGVREVFLNGVLTSRVTNIDFTNATNWPTGNPGVAANSWSFTLPAVTGIIWQLCAPIESWSAADISVRPRHSINTDGDVRHVHMIGRWLNDKGTFWTSGGTMTATPTTYASGGTNPARFRVVFSGTASQTGSLQTIDEIGTLPYNDHGWCTVMFPQTYMPGGGTCSWSIRNAADDGDLIKLDFDGTNLMQGATTLAPITAADRFLLMIHLNSDGRAAFSLHDLTADITSRNWWSGALDTWTPGAVGPIKQTCVRGSASVEMDGCVIGPWIDVVGVDSFSHANVTALTPVMAGATHLASRFSQGDQFSIPGCSFPQKQNGMKAHAFHCIAGRSGRSFSNFYTNVVAYMDSTYGIRLVVVDGGSINDIGSITNAATRISVVSTCACQHSSTIKLMLQNKNQIWYSSMIRREQGTYSATQLDGINQLNAKLKEMCREMQSQGLVRFSDPAASVADHATLFTAGDDVHFNAAGDMTVANYMVTTRRVVPRISKEFQKAFRPLHPS